MYQIDWKKWWTAVQAAEAAKQAEPEGWIRQKHERELTVLYSIRAHGRGRVHRRVAGLTHYEAMKLLGDKKLAYSCEEFTEADGRLTLELDLEDQAKFIGDRWKEFVKAAEQAA